MSEEERRSFAVPEATGEYEEIDLALLDRNDEDQRRVLIGAEHPELRGALRGGQREIHLRGATMDPVLHVTMHEIVANQLWENDPPEMWDTAQRLLTAGYERHEVLHMLASVMAGEVFDMMRNQVPHDVERVRAGLAGLPQSWEETRDDIPADGHMNRAERRAKDRQHRH